MCQTIPNVKDEQRIQSEEDAYCNSEIHTLLDLLIRHMPPQLHLVLTTRSNPSPPLAKWRAEGQLNEICGTDLHFTLAEVETFLERVLGYEQVHEIAVSLEESTKGWIAVLRLVALSLYSASDHMALAEHLDRHPGRYVSAYLVDEILSQQTPAVQDFILRTSILDQFCVELCEAITSGDGSRYDAQAYLDCLECMNMFIVPLDEQPGWYRFQRPFKHILESRLHACLSKEEIATLHRRASAWYAREGLTEKAIEQAMSAGDTTGAAKLIEARLPWAIEHEQWVQMERWLSLLPEEQQCSAGLLVARAWILEIRGQLEGMPSLLKAADQLLSTNSRYDSDLDVAESRALQVMIASLWCNCQFFTGQVQIEPMNDCCVLPWLQAAEGYGAHLALSSLALSYQSIGREDTALVELNNILRTQSAHLSNSAHLLFAQALIYMNVGKLQHVEQTAQHFLRLSQEANLALGQSWAHSLLGYIHYEWNNLDVAAHHFSAVIADQYQAHHWVAQEAMYGLALVYQAQGLHTQAKETTDALLEFVQRRNSISYLAPIYAFYAQLALLKDDVESAERWVEMAGEQWAPGSLVSFVIPPITKAQLLLSKGDETDVAQGQEILATLLQSVAPLRGTRMTIQALALQSLAYELQGRVTEALDTLERAIELARPGGFIRAFADLPPLVKLLQELRKRRKACQATDGRLDAYLQRLLVAINPTVLQQVSAQELMRQKGLEPLTSRELQILRLLSKDLTNKEIARELVVTSGTIKAHTNSIYRKLSVNNRRSAVTLSKSLDLLTTS